MLIKIKGFRKIKIIRARQVHALIKNILRNVDPLDRDKEHFFVIGLTRSNHLKFIELNALGTLAGVHIAPREIFRRSILRSCESIIICHNHPSGNKLPSDADKKITRQMVESGRILDIRVIDHVLVTLKNGYYSFAEEGEL